MMVWSLTGWAVLKQHGDSAMDIQGIRELISQFGESPVITLLLVLAVVVILVVSWYLKAYVTETARSHANDGTPDNPILAPVWHLMDPELKALFSGAAEKARRDGKDIVSTRDLFAAVNRLRPGPMKELLEMLPAGSLPDPIAADFKPDGRTITPSLQFSGCVRESLGELSRRGAAGKLSTQDVFVDIAKHGRGESVRRLRTLGVDAERIDEIVRQLGWTVVDRDESPGQNRAVGGQGG